jgi:hypothetical protein
MGERSVGGGLFAWCGKVGLVAITVGLIGLSSSAFAADLPMKAAPQPPPPAAGSDIHGFFDISFKNDYITPRGLLVTNTGLTTQILSGLVFNLYKDPGGFINSFSVSAGIWNDLWSKQDDPLVGPWNEFDWFVGGKVGFAKDWSFGVTYVEFLSPPGNFRTERNMEFSLEFDDSPYLKPIALHPYAKLFWAMAGDSTVVVGDAGNTYDIELGIVPTLDLKPFGVPVTLTAPTWITVGPTSYWNRGVTGCGPAAATPCATSNAGVVSTGLTAKAPLTFIPPRLGNWYIYGGGQFYHLINDSLLLAQTFTGTAVNYANAHRDVAVGFVGIGFGF